MSSPSRFRSSPWTDARTKPHSNHEPPRVLVAEDDVEMRRLVVEVLRKEGYSVSEATDGGRLLVEIAQQAATNYEDVDLIVSDVRMPICSGLQIVEALRSAHCATPIVLMTAFGDDATRARAALAGALLFDKPFDLDDLRMAIASLLGAGGARP